MVMIVQTAALCASVLTAQVGHTTAVGQKLLLDPLPSPDGQYLLSGYLSVEAEGMIGWSIQIADTTGRIRMRPAGPGIYDDVCSFWDEAGRAWVYSTRNREIICFGPTPSGWAEIYRNNQWKLVDGFVAPRNLSLPRPWSRIDSPPEMLPERVIEDSGPGWEYRFELPGIPSDLSFLRGLVQNEMASKIDWFVSEAESRFDEYGDDPGYIPWTLDISTGLPWVPEGMLAVSCSWWDYTGGAHGNSGSECWLFGYDGEPTDSPPWTVIGTEDLLADSAELVALSALVVESLAESLGEFADMDWIMEGAGPSWSNYGDLMPVPDSTGALAGFDIWFPDYRVAPYAAGPQYVYIPIELLRP